MEVGAKLLEPKSSTPGFYNVAADLRHHLGLGYLSCTNFCQKYKIMLYLEAHSNCLVIWHKIRSPRLLRYTSSILGASPRCFMEHEVGTLQRTAGARPLFQGFSHCTVIYMGSEWTLILNPLKMAQGM